MTELKPGDIVEFNKDMLKDRSNAIVQEIVDMHMSIRSFQFVVKSTNGSIILYLPDGESSTWSHKWFIKIEPRFPTENVSLAKNTKFLGCNQTSDFYYDTFALDKGGYAHVLTKVTEDGEFIKAKMPVRAQDLLVGQRTAWIANLIDLPLQYRDL